MKVSIIGGGGVVGSTAAFALQCGGAVGELCLIDANAELARGQAEDLLNGASLAADQRIYAGGLADAADSDLIVITAGLRRKPDESRLDLVHRNVDLFLSILNELQEAGCRKDAVLLVVSNPVDILTYLAARHSGLCWRQVIGLGTQLDSTRLRGYLGQLLNVPPSQINAVIFGEHGDSMVPIWSGVTVAGLPIARWPGFNNAVKDQAFGLTKSAGSNLIRLKGASAFAVGLAIREVVHAVALDQRRILPVSTLQHGLYGIQDVCLSVASEIGRGGLRRHVEIDLSQSERCGLQESARQLRQTLDRVAGQLPTALTPAQKKRTIPRSAWQAMRGPHPNAFQSRTIR